MISALHMDGLFIPTSIYLVSSTVCRWL